MFCVYVYMFEMVELGQIIYGFNKSFIGYIVYKCNVVYFNLVYVVNQFNYINENGMLLFK